ncbi:MAG: NAD(P)/FAD-dependent oxidoreductase, partial [Candidatus Methylomirabilis sp.]|nr:NAD(P)/FAD-dependent oxidoreductase [Deltaproteobacteria bacterium]
MINDGDGYSRIVIVGAGFSGLGMAIRLKQKGVRDFVVFEKADEVGGTWRDNTYPGAACDVESHLYSFSFAPNPNWSRSYSSGWEIQDYLVRCADRFGVRPFIRFGHQVTDARWDEARDLWRIETSRGVHWARVLIAGTGPLSEPSLPELPGLENFEGRVFHSARWDHDYDLAGKRVAVVGTGASAIQFVPRIQPKVGSLTVFQRTPPWILPRPDRAISEWEKRLFRLSPAVHRLLRSGIYWRREWVAYFFTRRPELLRFVQRMAKDHLRRQVKDKELRRRLTPDYTIGCKRILLASDYYPALAQPNVEVVTSALKEIGPNWVLARDGRRREVDAIVFGTGFHVTDMPAAQHIRGLGGRLLADDWAEGMEAYLGTAVAGYPNLFFMIGPNTGLGHNSMVYMIESQIAYLADALRKMRKSGKDVIEVRREVQDAY